MIWRACSMPGVELTTTDLIAPSAINDAASDDGAAIADAPVDAAPVAFVLTTSDDPLAVVAPPRARSRGTLPIVGMFVLATVAALYFGRAVLMPILFGMVIAVVLTPVVDKLSKLRIPEPIGAAIVMLAMVGSLVLAIEILVIPAWDVLAELPEQVQNLLAEFLRWVRSFRFGNLIAPRDTKQAAAQGFSMTAVLLQMAQGFIISAVSAMVLAYFLLSSGDLFLTKLVRVLPIFRDKVRAVTVVRTVQRDVATYFASVSMINLGLGFGVTLLTWGFGLPMPWFWGALVALLNFIPYIGAGTSAAGGNGVHPFHQSGAIAGGLFCRHHVCRRPVDQSDVGWKTAGA